MDIQEKIAKRKDRIEKISNLLKEDFMLVSTVLDESELRRATTIEKLKDYLKILEDIYGKDDFIYLSRVNEFNVCWDALSLKEVQSAESIPDIQTAHSRAREKSEARRIAIFKMLIFLKYEERKEAQ